ncbi:MAG: hypothetical protein LBL20_06655 [Treponema sp.]|jgi:hypothetical protein|nr:hypothetical protein [Treponema sp.]
METAASLPQPSRLIFYHKVEKVEKAKEVEEDHEPREQSLSRSGFHDYTRKTRLVSHEPREPSLWCP